MLMLNIFSILTTSWMILCLSQDLTTNNELLNIVKQAAGVYSLPTIGHKHHKLDKTVIITTFNQGFVTFLLNFNCFMRRLRMKYVAISLDVPLSVPNDILTYHLKVAQISAREPAVDSNASEFRSRSFNIITARKLLATIEVMQLGYDVLFCDLDVVILRDFWDLMIYRNMLYVHTLNQPCGGDRKEILKDYFINRRVEGNTGFYFVRSTPVTIGFWNEVYTAMQRYT